MPNFLEAPEIFSMPSLQAYSSISFLLLSCAVYYAFQITSEPDWKHNELFFVENYFENNNNTLNNSEDNATNLFNNNTFKNTILESIFKIQNNSSTLNELFKNSRFINLLNVAYIMINEPLCVWTLINMCYCLLILFSKFIQKIIFGTLRTSEQQMLREKFWNFVFYKFIFVCCVINVQYMDELILWCGWFSILGFLFLLTHLCKERFNWLSCSSSVSKWQHLKLLTLLSFILISTIPLFIVGIVFGMHTNFSTGAFLVSEVLLVLLPTLHCFMLYLVYLWDLNLEAIWEKRTIIIYYIELILSLLILAIDFCHHLHMIFWANIILSLSTLVILIQIRSIIGLVVRSIKKHLNYIKVLREMEKNFPFVSTEDLTEENNDCAICWDKMETARKLPCNHFFHTTCLRSWLEQDPSCPTCRYSLRNRSNNEGQNDENNIGNMNRNIIGNNENINTNNNINYATFYFDSSLLTRLTSSINVQASREIFLNQHEEHFTEQQLQNMGQEVLEFFPQFPLSVIVADLRNTRSLWRTIVNILNGRLSIDSSSDVNEENNPLPNNNLN